MIKIKHVLLFTVTLMLLVGVACASDISEDTTSTGSIAEEAAIQDTHEVSDNAKNIQANKINENIKTTKASNNNDENAAKTIEKTTNSNLKTATTVTNWKELQSAVNAANKRKNITFTLGKGTYRNSGTIIVNNTNAIFTIDGNGQKIDGNRQQVFIIEEGSSLVLKNFTILYAESFHGGAIKNSGTLTIIQSTFTKNSADNQEGYGGVIYNYGKLNITQSTFTGNLAYYGGVIHNNINGIINIKQSTFTKNTAAGNMTIGRGGAIYNDGGNITITQSTLTDNTAVLGGAIENHGPLTIINSTLANNKANSSGGAIENDGPLTIINSTLANNKVNSYGGAIHNGHKLIESINSNYTNNSARNGGAIFAYGNVSLTGNRFVDNHATDNKETIDLYGYSNGIFDKNVYKSTQISLKKNILTLKDNQTTYNYSEDVALNFTIELNHPNYYKDFAKGLDDITIYLNGNKIATTKYENYTLSNLKSGNYSVYYQTCQSKSNTVNFTVKPKTNWEQLKEAVRDAESQTKDTTLYLMEGNYTNTGTIEWFNPNMTLTIDGKGRIIDGNQLQVFNINGRSSMVLKNITIINAKSTIGGAIQNEGKLTVTHSTLANNTAEYGGAIENLGTLTVNQSTLTGNTAEDGGAIQNYGPFTITDSTLANNTASHYGGAIKNYQTLFTVTASNITNNTAERGGAIFSNGKTNLTGNTFINNTADNNETIDLNGYRNGHAEDNTYKNTDIALWKMKLNIKDDKKTFKLGEDVTLNYNFTIKNPEYYDENIMEKLGNITIYVNDEEYATTDNYKNYTLTQSKPGKYNVYIKLCNQKSNTNTFTVKSPITNWQQLSEAVNNTKDKTEDTTLYLGEGNYKNTGTINWTNPDMTLTIDGCGQTIDGNQQQVFNIVDGASFVLKNLTITNAKSDTGGAIYNDGTLNITHCTLTNNTATKYGGAIRNGQHTLTITDSTFKNNQAKRGAAIFTSGHTNLTHNTFTNNTADNNETIDLHGYRNAHAENNTYKNTDISLKTIELNIKNNQSIFNPSEEIILNYSIYLEHPRYYDTDIPEKLDDITLYINDIEYDTTKYENQTLSDLEPGEYTVYIKTCNQKSNNVTFNIIDENQIKITTWDVEMVRARGVTFSAVIDYKNTTINQGQVYFEIDGNPLVDETESTLYAPVKDNHADLPYEMPNDISLGKHTITAVYLYDDRIIATDDKTLTIIENIPEGAGDEDKNPSKGGKQETYTKDTRAHKAITNTIQSNIPTIHQIIIGNIVIPADAVITLGQLNEIFGQTFTNGHLLLYIDGELVYNGTVGDDIATVILEIIEKFLGKHELKVEFTDADGKTNTYTENVTIT